MFSTPIPRALGIWSDLWRCYYNDNSYGTDTAEIYIYRLLPDEPIQYATGFEKEKHAIALQAGKNLYELLTEFCDPKNCDCRIEIEGRPLGEWLNYQELYHRVHVRIIHNQKVKD